MQGSGATGFDGPYWTFKSRFSRGKTAWKSLRGSRKVQWRFHSSVALSLGYIYGAWDFAFSPHVHSGGSSGLTGFLPLSINMLVRGHSCQNFSLFTDFLD